MRKFCVLIALAMVFGFAASVRAEDDNVLVNGDFSAGPAGAAPDGWDHRTKGKGVVSLMKDGDDAFVRIGVKESGEDSFIQQTVKLPPKAAKVVVGVRYRYADIVKGEKSFQSGAIQARWTAGGKETGRWIDIAKFDGTSTEWIEKERPAAVPKDESADGILLRLALYGVKSGQLDVSRASITAQSADEVAAATAEARKQWRPAEAYGQKPSDVRYTRLARGVNINNWFGQPYNGKVGGKKGDFSAEWFRSFITDQDLSMLKSAGITNVRLVTEPEVFMNKADGSLKADLLPELDSAIKRLVDAGLAVQVDFHPKMPSLKQMNGKGDVMDRYARWVGEMSGHLSTTNPEMVFIELMNEPGGQGFYNLGWEAYQDRLITLARKAAPQHTLIVNGGGYMLWDKDTLKFSPHPDRNVVVAVHYYEPGQFTHQGATWMKPMYHPLRNVPWPLTEANLQAAIDSIARNLKGRSAGQEDKAAGFLRSAVKEGRGVPDKMAADFAALGAWAKEKDVRIVVNECGVYAKYAPPADRARYFSDLRKAFDKAGFAWTIWDYCGDFAITSGEAGQRQFDPDVAAALGLSIK